jgi:hypothetical protein
VQNKVPQTKIAKEIPAGPRNSAFAWLSVAEHISSKPYPYLDFIEALDQDRMLHTLMFQVCSDLTSTTGDLWYKINLFGYIRPVTKNR